MKTIIKEVRRKGNNDETLILVLYTEDGISKVDLDVITQDGRITMARTEHKTMEGAEQFFAESLEAMGNIYRIGKLKTL